MCSATAVFVESELPLTPLGFLLRGVMTLLQVQNAQAANREDKGHLEHLVLAKNMKEKLWPWLHWDGVRVSHPSHHQAVE